MAKAHEELRTLKTTSCFTSEIVAYGAWQAAGGIVTRKVVVVVRLNELVSREKTQSLKRVVKKA